jgi:hypothetical protein
MRTEVLEMKLLDREEVPVEIQLSFEPFINYLDQLSADSPVKKDIYQSIVAKFRADLTDSMEVDPEDTYLYQELLDLVYMVLTPIIPTETRHLWALSTPIPSKVFYSTNAFYNFHTCESSCAFAGGSDLDQSFASRRKAFIYRYVLKRFYNIEMPFAFDTFIQGLNADTGHLLYYKIQVDMRFVEVEVKDVLPELDDELLESWLLESNAEEYLERILPLSMFSFKGFTVVEFNDVTQEHAIENLKSILVDHSDGVPFDEIQQTLQTLAGKPDINFGILPFVKVNGRAVYLKESCSRSVIMNAAVKYHISEDVFHNLVEQYEDSAEVIVFNTISEQKQIKHPFLKVLKYAGISSYALFPVIYRKQLLGILEVYSNEKVFFDKALLSRLQTAMPYLAQLFKQMAEDFNDTVDQIVIDNFTSLKSQVKWKFNEAAWNYLEESHENPAAKMGKVAFNQVYPFYGAIDVRQSTQERNAASFTDLTTRISLLEETLDSLHELLDGEIKSQLVDKRGQWKKHFENYLQWKDEMTLLHVLDKEVEFFLEEAKGVSVEIGKLVYGYFDACAETNGLVYRERRNLEASLQGINQAINAYLLGSQKDLQRLFPHYFEKFRTDGIEYDIYVGQSMSPQKEFSEEYLHRLRLWQLKSMAEIAVITRDLKSSLPKPLQTTQLIFVHSTPINISFRHDEKRFDVEGGYSIRYEVVKKRIDKVLIKDTDERLTKPEKIAIVYFNQLEMDEYLDYIQTLQSEQILKDDLEFLELEELQGVNGLKALRVGVN